MKVGEYLNIIDKKVQRMVAESFHSKNYKNYKLDCLLLKKKPMSESDFKKKYKNEVYQEENIF